MSTKTQRHSCIGTVYRTWCGKKWGYPIHSHSFLSSFCMASPQSQPRRLFSLWSLGVFLTWTVTSFLCHHFAKTFLAQAGLGGDTRTVSDFTMEHLRLGALAATVLTAMQSALCHLLVDVGMPEGWGLTVSRISHVAATWFTNLSMAYMFASSTFAIKLMEPITSAVIQFAILGTPLSPSAILSLPVIVGGAIAFSGNPLAQRNLPFGIAAAFASNIILAFRNVALKMGGTDKVSSGITFKPITRMFVTGASFIFALLTLCWSVGLLSDFELRVGALAVISGVFHVLYSFVSTGIVLAHLSVVSHAVTNILKRVLVVLLLYISGTRSASPSNFLGLLVCTMGLFVYAWSKGDSQVPCTQKQGNDDQTLKQSRVKLYFVIGSTLMAGFGLGLVKDFVVDTNNFQDAFPMSFGLRMFTPQVQEPDVALTPKEVPYSSLTFSPFAFRKRSREELLPDLSGYLSRETANIQDFLKEDLYRNPNKSSFLSKKLRSNIEVIDEAQRLHFDIIGEALKGFKYAILLDIAAFENKGDPCITVGEIYYLARTKLEIIYYCSSSSCKEANVKKAAEKAKKYSPKELVILVHGGGNIVGYAFSDMQRFVFIREFKNYKIVVFPQSIWVPGGNFENLHFKRCVEKYCCNENLTFVMRDHLSYQIFKDHFSGGATKFVLAPDMAFQIGPVQRFISPVFDIMWIKRGDGETPGYKTIPHPPSGIRLHVSDWWKWLTPRAPSSMEKAFYVCTNGFFYLQRGRVIITDRLHGHILATLMNIPHVLIDNKAHKLSAYHRSWTASLENTVLTDDPAKALDLAMELLHKYNSSLPPRLPFLNINEYQGKNFDFAVPDASYS